MTADLLPIIFVGFVASLGLTPLSRQIAQRIGLMDKPSARKVHRAPIPLMGGLAIYGGFIIALLMFHNWPQHITELGAIVLGATGLAIVGFLDDRHELSPWAKFPAQFLAAGTVMLAGIRVDIFGNFLDYAITFVWIVGLINAINFLDNMDGLAAGLSAVIAGFLFVLSISQGQELVSVLAAALCGAAVGFLIYNFNPASTFMGDMGSLVLGFVLAILGIKLRFPTQPLATTWMIPLIVFGVPIFDMTLVVFTRLREGRSPFQGGKDHTSHRLVAAGFSPRRAVVTIYGASAVLGLAAIAVSQASVEIAYAIGAGVAIIGIAAFFLFMVIRARYQRA